MFTLDRDAWFRMASSIDARQLATLELRDEVDHDRACAVSEGDHATAEHLMDRWWDLDDEADRLDDLVDLLVTWALEVNPASRRYW